MRPGCENLEPRRYLAASLDTATKVLHVAGTSASNVIQLTLSGSNIVVTIDGKSAKFLLNKVKLIDADGQRGNDKIQIADQIKLPAIITGDAGNDTLTGGGGDDEIYGGDGSDSVAGGSGKDTLGGSTGTDKFSGGPGIDLVDYALRTAPVKVTVGTGANDGEAGENDNVMSDVEQVAGGSGGDSITGASANETLSGNGGNDTLTGGGGNDELRGGDGNDSLLGKNGNDSLRGGAGDDVYSGGADLDWADYSDHDLLATLPGNSMVISLDGLPASGLTQNFLPVEFDTVQSDVENVKGSAGPDQIVGSASPNKIDGGGGDDFIVGLDGNDTLGGDAGNDSLLGGENDDQLVGGPDSSAQTDADFLAGENGDDSIQGGADNDVIIGADGDDTVEGDDGDDDISGEIGNDSLSGGEGNDTILGGIDNDTIDGGGGVDFLSGDDGDDVLEDPGTPLPPFDVQDDPSLSAANQSPGANIEAAFDIDTVNGATGDDTITGGDGASYIFGGDGDDSIAGGAGDEQIEAGLGDDSVGAGSGNDVIHGDVGNDTLNGDDGNDIIASADSQPDTIDGGDGIDLVQFETPGTDTQSNLEGTYDQPEDDGSVTPPPQPEDELLSAEMDTITVAPLPPLEVQPSPVTVEAGVLKISGQSDASGAPLNDDISLSQSGSTITVVENGTSYPVPIAGLKGILIDVGGGSDFVGLATAGGASTISLRTTVLGGKGDDVLRGGNGNDSLVGGTGNDRLAGNKGNDVLNGGLEVANNDADGTDTLTGGIGEDTVLYTYRKSPLFLFLDGAAHSGAAGENDLIGKDVEDCFGGRGNDSITGNASRNVLSGGTGSDTIRAGAGNDVLIGSCSGDVGDSLFGDAGTDLITMAGDKIGDRYDVGSGEIEASLFLTKDPAPGGGFLDTPI